MEAGYLLQGSYGSLKSMKVQDFLVVKIMYLNVLNFPETVEKSIKVHIKRVLLLIKKLCVLFAAKQSFVRHFATAPRQSHSRRARADQFRNTTVNLLTLERCFETAGLDHALVNNNFIFRNR